MKLKMKGYPTVRIGPLLSLKKVCFLYSQCLLLTVLDKLKISVSVRHFVSVPDFIMYCRPYLITPVISFNRLRWPRYLVHGLGPFISPPILPSPFQLSLHYFDYSLEGPKEFYMNTEECLGFPAF